jgi:nicotinate-nucleotide adenylyltransferase
MGLDRMKVGLLGGSFNPVHNGHLRLAVEALEQAGLDRVELVPAYIPPHKEKEHVPSFSFRCRLIEAAIWRMPGLGLNRMEGERAGPSYTVDTLIQYHHMHPDREPFFVIGCPDFVQLTKWFRWRKLPELTHFIVVARERGDEELLDRFITATWPPARKHGQAVWGVPPKCRVQRIQAPKLELSSTLIRDKMAAGRSIRYLVPDPVWEELKGPDTAQAGPNS